MLLVVDIGNTHATCGLYLDEELVKAWRAETSKPASSLAQRVLRGAPRSGVSGVCVSSVVPWADTPLRREIKDRLACEVLFATAETTGVPIIKCRKDEVGADRLVNAVAAYEKYRKALIIVDFGTATTFDVITAKGEYAGGAIAPGVHLANRSLSDYTAKLPRADIKKTPRVIGYRTVESMQSGVFHGYVGMVNHLVDNIKKEMRSRPKVIATGGLANLIASSTSVIDDVHPNLTLEGLRLVWNRNH